MAIEFPSGAMITNVSVTHNIPTFTTESLNLKEKSKHRNLHRLEGSLDVSLYGLKNQKAWQAFIIKCKGRSEPITLDLPLHFKSDTVFSNPTITIAAGIGQTAVTLSAFSGNIDAGSVVTFLNDDKTYVVENDVTGGGTMTFFPPLRQAQLINSEIEVLNPVMNIRLDEDMQTIDFGTGHMVTVTLSFKEAL
ncbi:MAG: hypothetical protein COA84_14045 [Robiginitomaculum sp.]|nr:MAG: hypothetical protein COA84_14045 [Robiginitomaculum sp.]